MEHDIFDDYMGVQYREGVNANIEGKTLDYNPYSADSEMGKAWIDGFNGTDD